MHGLGWKFDIPAVNFRGRRAAAAGDRAIDRDGCCWGRVKAFNAEESADMLVAGRALLFCLAVGIALLVAVRTDPGEVLSTRPPLAIEETTPLTKVSLVEVTADAAGAPESASVQLCVNIAGVEIASGSLRLAIFSGESGFPHHQNALHRITVSVKESMDSILLPPLPVGDYAIAVFHDVDDNGRLNRAALGYPTEPYGFSNNARSTFGPPDYGSAEFTSGAGEKNLPIIIR